MQIRKWKLLVALLIAPAFAEETVTGDLINSGQWDVNGGILDHTTHFHTDYQGGSISQTIDISAYEGQQLYTYETWAYGCENHIGGHCGSGTLDSFTVTLTTDLGETFTETVYVTQSYDTYTFEFEPTFGDAQIVQLEVLGQDNGYWAGWYGPVFGEGDFTVTYDPDLVTVVLPATEDPTLQTTVLDSAIMPDTMQMDMGVPEIDASPPQVEVAAVQETPAPSGGMGGGQSEQPQPVATPVQSAPVAVSKSNDSGNSGSSNKTSSKGSVVTLTTTYGSIDVQNASAETLGNMVGDPSSPVAQALMVAVMAAQGVSLNDVKLKQPKLPPAPKLRTKRIKQQFWLDSIRSEARFQKHMVDKQWQK